MSRPDTGPPGNGTSPAVNRGRKTATKLRRVYSKPPLSASLQYASLIAHGYAQGLLEPFHCSCCGQVALDPVGRNEKREHLCESCLEVSHGC
jgi:hypothetical protein